MTMSLDHGIATFIVMFSIMLAVALPASQLIKNRVAGTRGSDRLRAVWYVARYDVALEYLGVSASTRVAQVNELKANLADAARQEGLARVLARLGRPDVLAQGVAGATVRPMWSRGVFAGAVVLSVTGAVHLFALASFTGAFEALASRGEAVHLVRSAWVTFDATMGESGHAASASVTSPWIVILPLLALLAGARVWRLTTAIPSRRASGATVSK